MIYNFLNLTALKEERERKDQKADTKLVTQNKTKAT